MDALKIISEGSIKAEKPQFNVGDTVRVDVRIKDGDRERIQAFEGTVIAKKHGGVAETFTVRRVAYGVGIERVFPINSPFVEKVTVVRKGKVRRASAVWNEAPVGIDNTVAVHIRHLREKLEINPSEPRYLKVVWGKGYKLEGDRS